MAKVNILLAPRTITRQLFLTDDDAESVRGNIDRYMGVYTTQIDMAGEAAAEEMFDLTNNPSRQEEREQTYGLGRSLSSGDIVAVDDEMYLCMSIGWKKL